MQRYFLSNQVPQQDLEIPKHCKLIVLEIANQTNHDRMFHHYIGQYNIGETCQEQENRECEFFYNLQHFQLVFLEIANQTNHDRMFHHCIGQCNIGETCQEQESLECGFLGLVVQ